MRAPGGSDRAKGPALLFRRYEYGRLHPWRRRRPFPSPILPVRAALRAGCPPPHRRSDPARRFPPWILGSRSTVYFAAAVNFRMALLPAMAANFTDRHSGNPHLREGVFYVIQFVGLNDSFDLFHDPPPFAEPALRVMAKSMRGPGPEISPPLVGSLRCSATRGGSPTGRPPRFGE